MPKTFTARQVSDDIHKAWKLMAALNTVRMDELLEAAILNLWLQRENKNIRALVHKAAKYEMSSKGA